MNDKLTQMILDHVNAETKRLDAYDSKVRNIHIDVDRGYNEGDQWLVKYTISTGYGDSDKTEGRCLHDVVTEYMRRKGWTEANKPMVLIESKVDSE